MMPRSTRTSTRMLFLWLLLFVLNCCHPVDSLPQSGFVSQDVGDVDVVDQTYDGGREGDQWWRNYEMVQDRADDMDDNLEMLYMYSVNPLQFAAAAASTSPASTSTSASRRSRISMPPFLETSPSASSVLDTSRMFKTSMPPFRETSPSVSSVYTNQPFVSRTVHKKTTAAPPTTTILSWTTDFAPETTYSRPSSTSFQGVPFQQPVDPLRHKRPTLQEVQSLLAAAKDKKSKAFHEAVTKKMAAAVFQPHQQKAFTSASAVADESSLQPILISTTFPGASPSLGYVKVDDVAAESNSKKIAVRPTAPTFVAMNSSSTTTTTPFNPYIDVSSKASDQDRPRYAKLLNRYSLLDTVLDDDFGGISSSSNKELNLSPRDSEQEIASSTEKSLRHIRNDVLQAPTSRSFQAAASSEETSAPTERTTLASSKRPRRRRPKTNTPPTGTESSETTSSSSKPTSAEDFRPLPRRGSTSQLPSSSTPPPPPEVPRQHIGVGGSRRLTITPTTSSPATIDGARTTHNFQQVEVLISSSTEVPTTATSELATSSFSSLRHGHGRTRAKFTLSTAFLPTSTDSDVRATESSGSRIQSKSPGRTSLSSTLINYENDVTTVSTSLLDDVGPATTTSIVKTHKPRKFRPRNSSTTLGVHQKSTNHSGQSQPTFVDQEKQQQPPQEQHQQQNYQQQQDEQQEAAGSVSPRLFNARSSRLPTASTRGHPAQSQPQPPPLSSSTRSSERPTPTSTPNSGRPTPFRSTSSLNKNALNSTFNSTVSSTQRSRSKFRSSPSSFRTTTTISPNEMDNSTTTSTAKAKAPPPSSPIGIHKSTKQRPDFTRAQKSKKPTFGTSASSTAQPPIGQGLTDEENTTKTSHLFTKKFSPRGSRFRAPSTVPLREVTVPVTEATSRIVTSNPRVSTTTITTDQTPSVNPSSASLITPINGTFSDDQSGAILEFSKLKRRRRPSTKIKKSIQPAELGLASTSSEPPMIVSSSSDDVLHLIQQDQQTSLAFEESSTLAPSPTKRKRRKLRVRKLAQRSTLSGSDEYALMNATTVAQSELPMGASSTPTFPTFASITTPTPTPSSAASSATITPITSTRPITTTSTPATSETPTTTATTTPTPTPTTSQTQALTTTTTPTRTTTEQVRQTQKTTTEKAPKKASSSFDGKIKNESTAIKEVKVQLTPRTVTQSSRRLKSDVETVTLQAEESGDSAWFSSSSGSKSNIMLDGNRQEGGSHMVAERRNLEEVEGAEADDPKSWFSAPNSGTDEVNQKGAESSPEDVKVEGIDIRPLLISRISEGDDAMPEQSDAEESSSTTTVSSEEPMAEEAAAIKPVEKSRTATFSVSSSVSTSEGEQLGDHQDKKTTSESDGQKLNSSQFIVIDKTELRDTVNDNKHDKKKSSSSGDNVEDSSSSKRPTTARENDQQETSKNTGRSGSGSSSTQRSRDNDEKKSRESAGKSTTDRGSDVVDDDRNSSNRSASTRPRSRSSSSNNNKSESKTSASNSMTTTTTTTTESSMLDEASKAPAADRAVSYFGEEEADTPVAEAESGAGGEVGVADGAESSYDPDSGGEIQESGGADEVIEHSDPNEDSAHLKETAAAVASGHPSDAAIEERSSMADDGGLWGSESSEPIKVSSSINVEVLSKAPRLMAQFEAARLREEKSSGSDISTDLDSPSEAPTPPTLSPQSKRRSRQMLRNILKAAGSDAANLRGAEADAEADEMDPADFDSVTTKRDVTSSVSNLGGYPVGQIKTVEDIVQMFDDAAAIVTTVPSKNHQPFKPPSKAVILKTITASEKPSEAEATATTTSSSTEERRRRPTSKDVLSGPTNCSKMERNMCPKSEGYPRDLVNTVLREHADKLNLLWSEIQADRTNTQNFPEEQVRKKDELSVCDSSIEALQPGWARDAISGKWMVVINTAQYPQVIRIESCLRPKRECLFISPYYKSTCVEHYSVQRLVAISPDSVDDGPTVGVFKFPCGCSCKVEMFLGHSDNNN